MCVVRILPGFVDCDPMQCRGCINYTSALSSLFLSCTSTHREFIFVDRLRSLSVCHGAAFECGMSVACLWVPGHLMVAYHVALCATTVGYLLRALCILPLPLLHHRTFLATGPLALSLPSASIYQDHYRYTEDLLTLSASSSLPAPQPWPTYQSPIKLRELAPFLCRHPDQAFASYIHSGLVTGFRIGFTHDRAQLRSRGRNSPPVLPGQLQGHRPANQF